MTGTDYTELLPALRFNLRETEPVEGCAACCGCASFSDEDLIALLKKHNGDVNAASYEGLLIKAENSAVSLPDGLSLPDNREYWLNLARLYRPCRARNTPRADDVPVKRSEAIEDG